MFDKTPIFYVLVVVSGAVALIFGPSCALFVPGVEEQDTIKRIYLDNYFSDGWSCSSCCRFCVRYVSG